MKLQALASRIHPQVALSQREAQNLLNVLQLSFRKQLNIVHPTSSVYPTLIPDNSNSRHQSHLRPHHSSKASAVLHLDTVLTNPLFAVARENHGTVRNDALAVMEDPMLWFVSRVAEGRADNSAARLCLNALATSLSKTTSGPIALREALRKAKAGTRVLEWMGSFGLHDSLEVQKDPELLALLIKPLIAENRRDIIEGWLLDPSARKRDGWRRLLLEHFLRAEVALGANLNNVILYFWDVSRRLRSTSHGNSDSPCAATKTAGLFVTLQMINQGSDVASELYTRWTERAHEWSKSSAFYAALLRIHDPRTPDAEPTLKLLRDGIHVEKARKMVRLCLDSAELLLSQENYAAASFVMEYAKKHHPMELGIKAKEDASPHITMGSELKRTMQLHVDERHHLEMLNGLSFG